MDTLEFPSIDAAVGHFFNLDELLDLGEPYRLEYARNWVAMHVTKGAITLRSTGVRAPQLVVPAENVTTDGPTH